MTTKLFNSNVICFQQSSTHLARPRMRKLLEEAVNYPLVTVYAGSGYGKTRAVYTFLQEIDAYTAWIQISERDNVTSRFWENYCKMISLSWPEAGKRLMEIGFPDTDEAFAQYTIQRRSTLSPTERFFLVYDDFHLLNNPDVLRFFERSAYTQPQNVTVILLSRTVPCINMVGMMLRDYVFAIREDDLCFTEDEISAYFNQLALSVTRRDIRDIYIDTQGWAFAVNLVGRSLRKDLKYERHALEVMKCNVYRFLEAETTQTASASLRRFLLRISLIDHLAADLIKVLANDDSLIDEMEQLHAYIRYDFHLDAYVIHQLFLDHLRIKQHLLTDEEKRDTYRKAGEWCECNHYQVDALSYYEKSGDYDRIVRIAHNFSLQMSLDMVKYTLNIVDRIPECASSRLPMFPVIDLRLKLRMGLLSEVSELVKKYSDDYESRPESPDRNCALAGIYGVWGLLRLITCCETDVYDFDIYLKKQREYFDKAPYTVPNSALHQSAGTWALPIGSNRVGAPQEYIAALSRSIMYIDRMYNGYLYGHDDLARGEYCFYRREFGDAEQHLKQALAKASEKNQYDIQSRSLLYLMRIAFSCGDLEAADKLLDSLKEMLEISDYLIRFTTFDVACGYYHLMLDQPHQIPDWLKGDFEYYTHSLFFENYSNYVKVRYHYQTRQFSALLAFIEKEWDRQKLLLGKIELKVLEALTLYQIKRKKDAITALTEAYVLAEPNEFVQSFIQYAKDMRTLTAAALKENECQIPKSWLENINRKASAYAKRRTHIISKYKAANNIGEIISLTRRESEILRDLSQGLSRTEIAASQSISVNTAKMVINSIYDKLSANSLADAIRIAVDRKIV